MTDTLRLPFPWALHEMLNQAEDRGFSNIVSWGSEGACFKVYDTKAFMKHVAPRYFRQTRYKSFQRQLHLYGFSRISSGKNRGHRAHELFIRHHKNLCSNMKPMRMRSQASDAIHGGAEVAAFSSNRSLSASPLYSDVEDDDACLRSFIDRFCEIPFNVKMADEANSEVEEFDGIFGDLSFFPTQDTEQDYSLDLSAFQPTPFKEDDSELFALQPTPIKEEDSNLFAPKMIFSSSSPTKGERPFGLGRPKKAGHDADSIHLDLLMSSFISRAA
jgi:hypothetical protein